jgi:hypothetical protein
MCWGLGNVLGAGQQAARAPSMSPQIALLTSVFFVCENSLLLLSCEFRNHNHCLTLGRGVCVCVCVVAGGQWHARGAWVREVREGAQLKLLGLAACLDAAIHHAIAERLDEEEKAEGFTAR